MTGSPASLCSPIMKRALEGQSLRRKQKLGRVTTAFVGFQEYQYACRKDDEENSLPLKCMGVTLFLNVEFHHRVFIITSSIFYISIIIKVIFKVRRVHQ